MSITFDFSFKEVIKYHLKAITCARMLEIDGVTHRLPKRCYVAHQKMLAEVRRMRTESRRRYAI